MKKLSFFFAVCFGLVLAGQSSATMRNIDYSFTVPLATAVTNTYVVRGAIKGIYVNVPAGKTNDIDVTTSQDTVLSVNGVTADTMYYPNVTLQNNAGASLDTDPAAANTNLVFGNFIAAGDLTIVVDAAANTTGTNDTTVTVIYQED